MPTAAVTKVEKQAPTTEVNSPIRQGIVIVEHKIRNLEKRKAKLETYRELQKDGKELGKDQLQAISKYDEVVQTLEFARELSKQFNNLANECAKNDKKKARKEALEKAQHELALIKEVLIIQDILSSMGQENVREDFLQGKAGLNLTSEELQQFDDLYTELTPKREDSVPFTDQFHSPAEHMLFLLEGKAKPVFGTTYAALKEKLQTITKSGYFDQNLTEEVHVEATGTEVAAPPPEVITVVEEPQQPDVPLTIVQEAQVVETKEEEEETEGVPEGDTVLSCTFQSRVVDDTVRAPLDPSYYASSLRVFKSGPIDFMQENELDTPDVLESSIPTLTYTNQSYTPVDTGATPTTPVPVEPVPPPQQIETTTFQTQSAEEKEWTTAGAGGGGGDAENSQEWVEQPEESWSTQTEHHWQQSQPQQNDGFIPAGGSGRGRGGRGRGGGDRGNKGGRGTNRTGTSSRGGYNREGGYNRDNGYYQNGYRERGDRGTRGRGGTSSERPSGGRGGGGRGGRGGGGGNYRGNNYKQ